MKDSPDIFTRLKRSRNLPTLPQVLLKLIEACNDASSTPQQLSDITSKDPSISTKILQLVNSADSGLPIKINSLDRAVVYLGADTVKNIAISASVLQVFGKTQGNGVFNLPRFWWHSLMSASLSKAIAEEVAYPSPQEAFLSGLLHDIGKLLLWVHFRKEYGALLSEAQKDPSRLLAGETAIGAPHQEVGAWLIGQWRLNSFMADAIRYHHHPSEQVVEALPLVRIVYAANLLSQGEEDIAEDAPTDAGKMVQIERPRLQELVENAKSETIEVAKSFGISISAPANAPTLTLESDKAAREALLSEVKNISLVYGTLQSLLGAASRETILQTAEQGFTILFDVEDIFFFLYDDQKNVLVGQSVPGNITSEILDKLIIPLSKKKSIFARAFSEVTSTNSFSSLPDYPLSIGEEQILRQLGTEGMVCVPMRVQGTPLGLIVIGVSESQAAFLLKQKKLLDLYVDHVSMCLNTDIIKRSQAEIIQEERINALTLLSRKVVHEVNNPLGIIKNYLKILGFKLPEKHPAQTELGIIGEEIDRVSLLIRRLSDFSEHRPALLETVRINELLFDLLRLLKEPLFQPADITLRFEPDDNAPPIISEKNGLKQVFINLIKNAVEAMGKGGSLKITTKYFPLPANDSGVADSAPSGKIEIRISDTGPGIPSTIKKRLFEPFVSSKNQSRGVGLSIVHSIIRELNGTIACESKTGMGTTFIITLPGNPGKKL